MFKTDAMAARVIILIITQVSIPYLVRSLMAWRCSTRWRRRLSVRLPIGVALALVASVKDYAAKGGVLVTGENDRPTQEIKLHKITIHANPIAG